MATGNVVLNNDLINKNKDEDIGKGIEEQISKLEELKGEIEGAEDALWDIEDQLYELTQRGRDEYIDFQKDVYNALVKQRQDEIDKYSEYISTLAEANPIYSTLFASTLINNIRSVTTPKEKKKSPIKTHNCSVWSVTQVQLKLI